MRFGWPPLIFLLKRGRNESVPQKPNRYSVGDVLVCVRFLDDVEYHCGVNSMKFHGGPLDGTERAIPVNTDKATHVDDDGEEHIYERRDGAMHYSAACVAREVAKARQRFANWGNKLRDP